MIIVITPPPHLSDERQALGHILEAEGEAVVFPRLDLVGLHLGRRDEEVTHGRRKEQHRLMDKAVEDRSGTSFA
jgi:hypothetical protein